jgi:hypothetical protein
MGDSSGRDFETDVVSVGDRNRSESEVVGVEFVIPSLEVDPSSTAGKFSGVGVIAFSTSLDLDKQVGTKIGRTVKSVR